MHYYVSCQGVGRLAHWSKVDLEMGSNRVEISFWFGSLMQVPLCYEERVFGLRTCFDRDANRIHDTS